MANPTREMIDAFLARHSDEELLTTFRQVKVMIRHLLPRTDGSFGGTEALERLEAKTQVSKADLRILMATVADMTTSIARAQSRTFDDVWQEVLTATKAGEVSWRLH